MVRSFTSFSLSSSLTSTRALSYSASYSTWTNKLQNDCSELWTLFQTNYEWLLKIMDIASNKSIVQFDWRCFNHLEFPSKFWDLLKLALISGRVLGRRHLCRIQFGWCQFLEKNLTTSGWCSFLSFVIVIVLISVLLMFCSPFLWRSTPPLSSFELFSWFSKLSRTTTML